MKSNACICVVGPAIVCLHLSHAQFDNQRCEVPLILPMSYPYMRYSHSLTTTRPNANICVVRPTVVAKSFRTGVFFDLLILCGLI